MSFCFAPESLLSRDGRRVMWAWLTDRNHPILSGVQTLPRELALNKDGALAIRPLRELKGLRFGELQKKRITVKSDGTHDLEEIKGDALELELVYEAPTAKEFGLHLLTDDNGENGLEIGIDTAAGALTISPFNLPFKRDEGLEDLRLPIHPPFVLKKGEDLVLRVFIDKNIVEVFANDRQAAVVAHERICRDKGKAGAFWKREGLNEGPCDAAVRENPSIVLFSKGADVRVKTVTAWKMRSIYE